MRPKIRLNVMTLPRILVLHAETFDGAVLAETIVFRIQTPESVLFKAEAQALGCRPSRQRVTSSSRLEDRLDKPTQSPL